MERGEDQQMNKVVKWFKDALDLPRTFHVKDIHTEVNYKRFLQGANVKLTGGGDIEIGPSNSCCVWIETKKKLTDSHLAQAMGELFLLDHDQPLNAMVVLTDCNDDWIIFFFLETKDRPLIAKANISDRGIALSIIKQFVLVEGEMFNELIGKLNDYKVDLDPLLRKRTKFVEIIQESRYFIRGEEEREEEGKKRKGKETVK